MLDYEIIGYKVEFHKVGAVCWFEREFDTEEEAVTFVKEKRSGWDNYRIVQARSAIIDF